MPHAKYLYLRNGSIWTGDPVNSRVESMIICGDKIAAIGETCMLDSHPYAAEAVRYDLDGRTVLPGFSDCHIHVLTSAKAMHSVDLSAAKSLDDVISLIRERAAMVPADSWIYATLLNENNWDVPKLPLAEDIDKAGISNPVLIHRICTHASIANSKALSMLNIQNLALSNIDRFPSGKPTGILYDDAQLPAYDTMEKSLYTRETLIQYLDDYLKYAASLGLTSLHTCSAVSLGMGENLGLYQDMMDTGRLSCRVYCVHDELSVPPMGPKTGNEFVCFEGFKLFIDGALGSRTAAMSLPYHDDPSTYGILIHEFDELLDKLCEATRRCDHILVHAIGDRAIEQQLNAIEKVCSIFRENEIRHPYLLNHVEICPPKLIDRMKKLPIACVIQPTYVPSDIDMVPARVGTMEKYACNWMDMINAGITLCGSSDNPIESLNPLDGIWALVNRTSWDGTRIWHEDQKLSLDQALSIYTVNPAKAYSTWHWNGSLTPGKVADLVILDNNIFETPVIELNGIKVSNTLLAGSSTFGSIPGWDFL